MAEPTCYFLSTTAHVQATYRDTKPNGSTHQPDQSTPQNTSCHPLHSTNNTSLPPSLHLNLLHSSVSSLPSLPTHHLRSKRGGNLFVLQSNPVNLPEEWMRFNLSFSNAWLTPETPCWVLCQKLHQKQNRMFNSYKGVNSFVMECNYSDAIHVHVLLGYRGPSPLSNNIMKFESKTVSCDRYATGFRLVRTAVKPHYTHSPLLG